MTSKECFNCNQIKEGLPITWWDEENRESNKFCCWDCSQNLIQKELDKKNCSLRKKFFLEALEKCKK